MKVIKKMNRGLIFLFILIIATIIYLVIAGIIDSSNKKEIVKLSQEYLQAEMNYHILPEEYRENGTEMPDEEVDEFIDEMKNELSKFYVDNKSSYENLFEYMESDIRDMSNGILIVTNYEKVVQRITDVNFDNNKATATLVCLTSYNGKTFQTNDYLAFQKINDEWKLTYSELTNLEYSLDSYFY